MKTVFRLFFKSRCNQCAEIIQLPLVSDFEYGVFIFQTIDGKHFGYSNAVGNRAWELVSTIIEQDLQLEITASSSMIKRFQKTVCSLADPYQGVGFHSNPYVCPLCQSNIDVESSAETVKMHIPELTFSRLLNMSADEQKNHVLAWWRKHG